MTRKLHETTSFKTADDDSSNLKSVSVQLLVQLLVQLHDSLYTVVYLSNSMENHFTEIQFAKVF